MVMIPSGYVGFQQDGPTGATSDGLRAKASSVAVFKESFTGSYGWQHLPLQVLNAFFMIWNLKIVVSLYLYKST